VCLVTGASSGIGRATAELLAQEGASVIALGRDRESLDQVAAATGGRVVQADLSIREEVDRAAAEATAAGPVDVLVNNAGEGWFGSFADMDLHRAEELMRTNLMGPIRLTHALLPGMVERGRGAVVNVASIAGHVGVRNEAVYSATKAGLIAFGESLRQELMGAPIRVSVVSPGVVSTAFFERQGHPYHRRWPRLISPDRVAGAILRAIRTGKPQVFVPRWVALPAWMRGVWPWAYRKGADRFG
jgi:short-subunit dehydrogenase